MDNDSTEPIRTELNRLRSDYDDLRLEVDQLVAAGAASRDFGLARKRGILASAGSTTESILKFIYRREGKDKDGKPADRMTLDVLIPPLRGQVPPHIEVHIRTVQAWRNMGVHDKGNISKVNEASIQIVSNALNQVVVWFFVDYMGGEFAGLASIPPPVKDPPPPPEADLKHYVYVSRTKVEMLYAQIPSAHRRNLAAQLKVDLPPDTFVHPGEGIADDALLAKTKLVVQFLEEQGEVGTVDEPGAYFKGQLPLRWGPYGDYFDESQLVYFGGVTVNIILGLGGSLKHVLGQVGGSHPSSHSATGCIVDVLTKELENSGGYTMNDDEAGYGISTAVDLASTQMSGPKENIEFVARKLFYSKEKQHCDDGNSRQVLLGSPIYAALADA